MQGKFSARPGGVLQCDDHMVGVSTNPAANGSAFFPTPHSCTSSETPRISLSKVAVVAVAIPVHPRFVADRLVTSQ